MSEDLKLTIKAESKEVRQARKDVDDLGRAFQQTNEQYKNLTSTFSKSSR